MCECQRAEQPGAVAQSRRVDEGGGKCFGHGVSSSECQRLEGAVVQGGVDKTDDPGAGVGAIAGHGHIGDVAQGLQRRGDGRRRGVPGDGRGLLRAIAQLEAAGEAVVDQSLDGIRACPGRFLGDRDAAGAVAPVQPEAIGKRSQDLAETFHDAGQFYCGRTQSWLDCKAVFSASSYLYELPQHLVQDIDTADDWLRAELLHQLLLRQP